MIASFGLGFAVPYFALLNEVEVQGDELLARLPRRNVVFLSNHQFREGGVPVERPVDLEGAARVRRAIAEGWLLHFPAGTTQKGAPLRPGVARLLHETQALAVPLRVDGFRELLLHRQIPGKLFRQCSLRLFSQLDLAAFQRDVFSKEAGDEVLRRIETLIGGS